VQQSSLIEILIWWSIDEHSRLYQREIAVEGQTDRSQNYANPSFFRWILQKRGYNTAIPCSHHSHHVEKQRLNEMRR